MSWEQKLLPGDQMRDPRLLLTLLCSLQKSALLGTPEQMFALDWCLHLKLESVEWFLLALTNERNVAKRGPGLLGRDLVAGGPQGSLIKARCQGFP